MFDYLTLVQGMHIIRMLFDIIVVWILIYYIIKIVRGNNKTTQIFKGIIFLILVQAIAKYFGLETLAYLTDNIMTWGFLALIIIFQPEIRSILERLGKSNVFTRIATLTGNEKEELVQALMDATSNLAEYKTGALITLEQSMSLTDYIKTGVQVNSIVTAELLCSIFATTTPLHDGAVIIQGDRLSCASAYFPPTTLDLPTRYGARHRAAIGISEITDAITIVVSEETGRVAIAEQGKLIQMNEKKLRAYLNRVILNRDTVTSEAVTPTSSKSVSIDTLFEKEVENLEEEYKEKTEQPEIIAPGQKAVVLIDENDEKIVEDEPFTPNKDMKVFEKSNFKSDSTDGMPIVGSIVSNDISNTGKIPIKEIQQTKTVDVPVTKKGKSERTNKKEEKQKTGFFSFLRKDKKVKKTDVELIVKEVAKEIHTTQQLKLQEIREANEAAERAAEAEKAELTRRKLAETKKLVVPVTNQQRPVQTTAPTVRPKPINDLMSNMEVSQPKTIPVVATKQEQVMVQKPQSANEPIKVTPVVVTEKNDPMTISQPTNRQTTQAPSINVTNPTNNGIRTVNIDSQIPRRRTKEADIEVPVLGSRRPKGGNEQ